MQRVFSIRRRHRGWKITPLKRRVSGKVLAYLWRMPIQVMLALGLAAAVGAADDAIVTPDVSFFETKIRPVLVEHCYECHAENSSPIQGGLLTDTRDGLHRGGDSGPAVVPHQPEQSLLLDALRYDGFEMPPRGKLPASVVADFETWIEGGAVDPRDGTAEPVAGRVDIDAGRRHWAFQPLNPPAATGGEESDRAEGEVWAEGQIDRIIWERLQEASLSPAPDADRATLLRRVHFDLTGLPPTSEQLRDFTDDPSPDAFADLVDRLLRSPRFGERWAQHWLDLARFSESSGGGRSLLYGKSWRYRDYVIKAFNEDKPYDRFVMEQIAGDLLPYKNPEEGVDNLIATAFLLLGPHNFEDQDKEKLRMDVIDEQVDVVGRVFLGMTLGCARCHDHKFDPVPTTDYYALAGIFRSTDVLVDGNVSRWTEREVPLPAAEQKVLQSHRDAVARLQRQIDRKPAGIAVLQYMLKLLKQSAPPNPPTVMAVGEAKDCGDWHVCIRGDAHSLGPVVPRGVLSVIEDDPRLEIAPGSSGRLELANWIASRDNPLTARVMANRIWHQLFGAGIVRTVDNFGLPGEPPSHPELLDYLANRLVQQGWSTKALIREIVLSRTYQLSSRTLPDGERLDPSNRLLSRQNRRRRDAEALRDAVLMLSGSLDLDVGGNTVRDGTRSEYGYQFEGERRSIYLPVFRNRLPDIFAVFDFADPNTSTGRRNVSTLSTQALFLMNSPLVLEHARTTAERLLANPELQPEQRVEQLYREALGRVPTVDERRLAIEFVGEQGDLDSWALLSQAVIASIDFLYVQ